MPLRNTVLTPCQSSRSCGADYTVAPRVLEVDQDNPRSQGGMDAYENLMLLWPPQDKAKRDRDTLSRWQQGP